MTVYELNSEQYKELCQRYITEFWTDDEYGTESPSWEDLACADELVSEDVIYRYYDGVDFVEEDFSCAKGVYVDGIIDVLTNKWYIDCLVYNIPVSPSDVRDIVEELFELKREKEKWEGKERCENM